MASFAAPTPALHWQCALLSLRCSHNCSHQQQAQSRAGPHKSMFTPLLHSVRQSNVQPGLEGQIQSSGLADCPCSSTEMMINIPPYNRTSCCIYSDTSSSNTTGVQYIARWQQQPAWYWCNRLRYSSACVNQPGSYMG